MRAVSTSLVLLLLAPSLAWAQEVRFGTTPLPEGSLLEIEGSESARAEVALTVDGAVIQSGVGFSQSSVTRGRIQVLSAAKASPANLRLTYEEGWSRMVMMGMGETEQSAIVGRGYLVKLGRGEAVITREDGEPISSEEEDLVSTDVEALVDPMGSLLPARMTVGEAVTSFPTWAAREFNDDVLSVKEASLVLKEVRGEEAVFLMKMDLVGVEQDFGMDAQLQGELLVDIASSRLSSFSLAGPMQLDVVETDEGATMKIAGAGELSMIRTYLHIKPAGFASAPLEGADANAPAVGSTPDTLRGLLGAAYEAIPSEERVSRATKNLESTKTLMQQMMTSSGSEKPAVMLGLADAYAYEGLHLMLDGQEGGERWLEKATKLASQVRANYPDTPVATASLERLWVCAMFRDQLPEAATHAAALQAAATTPEQQALAGLLLGETQAAQGQPDQALATFEAARKLGSPVAAVLALRVLQLEGRGTLVRSKLPPPVGAAPGWMFELDRLVRDGILAGELSR